MAKGGKRRRRIEPSRPPYANENLIAWQPIATSTGLPEVAIRRVAWEPSIGVVAETEDGRTFRSANEGVSWTAGPPSSRDHDAEIVEAADPRGVRWRSETRTKMVSFSGGGPRPMLHRAGIYVRTTMRSIDGGKTWLKVRDDSASAFAFDGRGRTWVAGSGRLWVLEEGGHWREASKEPAVGVVADGDRIVYATGAQEYVSSDGGDHFVPIGQECLEYGPWGSIEIRAVGIRYLAASPDGAVWAISTDMVFRLRRGAQDWESLNLGLYLVPGEDRRDPELQFTSLVALPSGNALVSTQVGIFKRTESRAESLMSQGVANR